MRLQKFLARCGIDSRRKCEQLILDGRIAVNGKVTDELGAKVDPLDDTVTFDGRPICLPSDHHTFKLNKPRGYLTSMSDPHGRRCVSELIDTIRYPSLFPVGRLDEDTSGLLLFTTDGELGHALMHPSTHVDKTYIAHVSGDVSETELDRLRAGITLAPQKGKGEDAREEWCQPAKCRIIAKDGDATTVTVTIHEGKNRQVRRMFKALGHEVLELERVSIGPLQLGDIAPGQAMELTDEELAALERSISHAERP